MALIVEGMTLVFLNEVINDKYHGGLKGFTQDWDNGSFCTDGFISKISYFEESDATAALISMDAQGLSFVMDFADDIAVFLHSGFLATPCVWLETHINDYGHLECRYALDHSNEVHIPDYFLKEDTLANYLGQDGNALAEYIFRLDGDHQSGVFLNIKDNSVLSGPKVLVRH